MGRDKTYPKEYTTIVSDNLDKLLKVIEKVESKYVEDGGKPFTVNSGWRPSGINAVTSNASAGSKHLLGLAVDVGDSDCKIWKWVLENVAFLKENNIHIEDKRWTSSDESGGWVHFQIVPPKSGKFIYIPSGAPPRSTKWWDGKLS